MNTLIKEASALSFEEDVLKSSLPVLLDFWAPWCGPCKMIAPFLDQLATEFEGRVQIVKVNTSDEQDLAIQNGIRNIPTLMFFKDGQVVDTKVGAGSLPVLREFIEKNL